MTSTTSYILKKNFIYFAINLDILIYMTNGIKHQEEVQYFKELKQNHSIKKLAS